MKKNEAKDLYLVSAMGRDVSGLIALITSIISGLNGNIIDIEENVVHGLFSIFLIVDLTGSKAGLKELKIKMEEVANQTDLKLIVEKIQRGEKTQKNLIFAILLGKDHPGIVSKAAVFLANQGINIEKTTMIARGKLFAMEMYLDIGKCHLQINEVEENFKNKMSEIDIQAFFQNKNVYKKAKRFIVFDFEKSLIDKKIFSDILMKTAIDDVKIKKFKTFREAFKLFNGMESKILKKIADQINISSEGEELIRALKGMGYGLVLISSGAKILLTKFAEEYGFDYVFANELEVDQDGKLTGGFKGDLIDENKKKKIIKELIEKEDLKDGDIIAVGDTGIDQFVLDSAGLEVVFDEDYIMDLYTKNQMSENNLIALLYCLGLPR